MLVHGFSVLSVGRHGAQERLVHILTDQEAECKLAQGGPNLQRLTASAVFCQPGPLLSLCSLPKVEDQAFKT